jgi:hypothetical protein
MVGSDMNREPITLYNLLMRARLQDQKYVWRNYRKDVFLLGNSLCFIFHAIPNGGRMWFRAAIFIWRAVCGHLPVSHHYDLKKSIIEMLNNFSFVLCKNWTTDSLLNFHCVCKTSCIHIANKHEKNFYCKYYIQ